MDINTLWTLIIKLLEFWHDLLDLCLVTSSGTWATDHFVSIQLCLVLPPPSSSSCTCILLSTFLYSFSRSLFQVGLFIGRLLSLWPCGVHCSTCFRILALYKLMRWLVWFDLQKGLSCWVKMLVRQIQRVSSKERQMWPPNRLWRSATPHWMTPINSNDQRERGKSM